MVFTHQDPVDVCGFIPSPLCPLSSSIWDLFWLKPVSRKNVHVLVNTYTCMYTYLKYITQITSVLSRSYFIKEARKWSEKNDFFLYLTVKKVVSFLQT